MRTAAEYTVMYGLRTQLSGLSRPIRNTHSHVIMLYAFDWDVYWNNLTIEHDMRTIHFTFHML